MTTSFDHFASECRADVEHHLCTVLGQHTRASTTRLSEAVKYACLDGGKRVRPLLVYAAAQAISGAPASNLVRDSACAIECIHAYSLVHDDLPAMDDDNLRRGKPTVHIQFDHATAILAGDALQTHAFALLSEGTDHCEQRIKLIQELARASGSDGMVGGQMIDLLAVGNTLTQNDLEEMHRLKTGALIRASVRMGAISCNATDQQVHQLSKFGEALGLAFQIQDDILDVVGDSQVIGKNAGSDAAQNKPNFVTLLGLDGAGEYLKSTHKLALDAIASFDSRADLLRAIATYVVERNK